MENEKKTNVWDRFLMKQIIEQKHVDIIMRTGFHMRNAAIVEFDDEVVVVNADGVEQMLNKNAIATIRPPFVQNYAPRQPYVNADWRSPAREFIRDT